MPAKIEWSADRGPYLEVGVSIDGHFVGRFRFKDKVIPIDFLSRFPDTYEDPREKPERQAAYVAARLFPNDPERADQFEEVLCFAAEYLDEFRDATPAEARDAVIAEYGDDVDFNIKRAFSRLKNAVERHAKRELTNTQFLRWIRKRIDADAMPVSMGQFVRKSGIDPETRRARARARRA